MTFTLFQRLLGSMVETPDSVSGEEESFEIIIHLEDWEKFEDEESMVTDSNSN